MEAAASLPRFYLGLSIFSAPRLLIVPLPESTRSSPPSSLSPRISRVGRKFAGRRKKKKRKRRKKNVRKLRTSWARSYSCNCTSHSAAVHCRVQCMQFASSANERVASFPLKKRKRKKKLCILSRSRKRGRKRESLETGFFVRKR